MDTDSAYVSVYHAESGPTTSVASGMATSSGEGHLFCRLTMPNSTGVGSDYYYARWHVPFGTVAGGGVATYISTQKILLVLEGEAE